MDPSLAKNLYDLCFNLPIRAMQGSTLYVPCCAEDHMVMTSAGLCFNLPIRAMQGSTKCVSCYAEDHMVMTSAELCFNLPMCEI